MQAGTPISTRVASARQVDDNHPGFTLFNRPPAEEHRLNLPTSRTAMVLTWCLTASAGAFCAGTESVKDGFITVPGGPVWYRISGTGSGIPLLVLHGGPGGTSCGFSLLEPLGQQRPVVRYDQLGTGRSGRPEDLSLWEVGRFIEALHSVRTQLGLENLHLLGHSWGGALAAAYVLEKGTTGIISLTLSSPLLSTERWVADARLLREQLPPEIQAVLLSHEEAGTTDSEEYREASGEFYARHVYAGEKPLEPDTCKGAPWNSFIYEYMWGPTEFHATGTLLGFDVTDRLHEIDVPVLFITGEFDEARPETVMEFQQSVAGARLEVIEGAAHATLAKRPEQYRALLERFLDAAEAGWSKQ
jgi:proline iminopeptidase